MESPWLRWLNYVDEMSFPKSTLLITWLEGTRLKRAGVLVWALFVFAFYCLGFVTVCYWLASWLV